MSGFSKLFGRVGFEKMKGQAIEDGKWSSIKKKNKNILGEVIPQISYAVGFPVQVNKALIFAKLFPEKLEKTWGSVLLGAPLSGSGNECVSQHFASQYAWVQEEI